jgi:uncharacterized protein YndB with AHSA1/START domain
MRFRSTAALLLAGAFALPASAAVESSAADGFLVHHTIDVPVDAKRAFAEVIHPERWWNDKHTWSGSAANLSLEANAGGCWCERWATGEAEHGVVIRVVQDENLRLRAAFGPLQAMAVNGVFDITMHGTDTGTRIDVTYRVTGAASASLDKLAAPVDGVIGEQAQRLQARFAGEAK